MNNEVFEMVIGRLTMTRYSGRETLWRNTVIDHRLGSGDGGGVRRVRRSLVYILGAGAAVW